VCSFLGSHSDHSFPILGLCDIYFPVSRYDINRISKERSICRIAINIEWYRGISLNIVVLRVSRSINIAISRDIDRDIEIYRNNKAYRVSSHIAISRSRYIDLLLKCISTPSIPGWYCIDLDISWYRTALPNTTLTEVTELIWCHGKVHQPQCVQRTRKCQNACAKRLKSVGRWG